MSNILNHNRTTFDFEVSKSDYWDMHLYKQQSGGYIKDGLQDDCLSAYITTTLKECISGKNLMSLDNYKWPDAVNKGVELKNIGLTGVDNGLLLFDRNITTEDEFNEIYRNSVLEIDSDDMRLFISPVGGNNKIYSYDMEFVEDENENVSKLNGGFYQGFFKTDKGCDYQILPTKLGNGWCMEFVLKPEFDGFEDECVTFEDDVEYKKLNDVYPSNKGIFFYVGTRAENKWYKYYNSSDKEDIELETASGEPIVSHNNIVGTNNKHITYNRTRNGFVALDGHIDTDINVKFDDRYPDENYFILMNRAKNGYTALTASELRGSLYGGKQSYDILADLFRNALAFQIKDDGSIGYKFMVKDCDSETGYTIKEEWSYPGMVHNDMWCHIAVRVVPVIKYSTEKYNYIPTMDYMRLMFYVNGKLVLYSRQIPTLLLRMLNDTYEKQEAVPYNISIGGGTQGLCDVIYSLNSIPDDVLYLEKEFGGSFIGYFKTFRFHTCNLNYQQIYRNFLIENTSLPVMPKDLFIYYGCFNMYDYADSDLKPSQIPLLDSQIQDLSKIPANNNEFLFKIVKGVNRIVIAYPYQLGELYSVVDVNSFGFNIVVAFKHEIRDLFVKGRYEKYYVYKLDYAFLNDIENIYKVKIKK